MLDQLFLFPVSFDVRVGGRSASTVRDQADVSFLRYVPRRDQGEPAIERLRKIVNTIFQGPGRAHFFCATWNSHSSMGGARPLVPSRRRVSISKRERGPNPCSCQGPFSDWAFSR